jgi:hypothetical protein
MTARHKQLSVPDDLLSRLIPTAVSVLPPMSLNANNREFPYSFSKPPQCSNDAVPALNNYSSSAAAHVPQLLHSLPSSYLKRKINSIH